MFYSLLHILPGVIFKVVKDVHPRPRWHSWLRALHLIFMTRNDMYIRTLGCFSLLKTTNRHV